MKPNATRRALLGAGLAAPLLLPTGAACAQLKSSAHILIVGSGLGGLPVANRLRAALDGARITVVDRKQEYNYQPGYTLVATGVWPVDKVRDRNADFMPAGVDWVQEMAVGFDPLAQTVSTDGGRSLRYDFLVVATGV